MWLRDHVCGSLGLCECLRASNDDLEAACVCWSQVRGLQDSSCGLETMFVVLGLFECLRASDDDLEAACVCWSQHFVA